MDEKINFLTLGIRYRRSFGVIDRIGEIMDFILHDSSSPFDPDFFPSIYEGRRGGRLLANSETNESLAVDADNVVLCIQTKKYITDFETLKTRYLEFIKKGVFHEFNIQNITRVGIVFDHQFNKIPSLDNSIESLTKHEVDLSADLHLRFSKKIPVLEAQYKKDIVDFYNAIFTFEKEDNKYLARLDFQMYFDPEVENIDDVPFDPFFKKATNYLSEKFQPSLEHEK